MKNLYNYLFLVIFYMYQGMANSLEVTNLTAGQISVTIQTSAENITQSAPVNLNPLLNDINEPAPNPTIVSFTNSPIQKIVITRFTPNMPQTIYYDGQNTVDAQQIAGGIHNLDMTRQGKMIVWNDYVEINNVAYSMTDLQSYIVRCNKLQDNLSPTNLDAIQSQLDDITSSVQAVQASDFASQLVMQLATIQNAIDTISNNIKLMKTLNTSLQTVQDLRNNISLGNNNFTGTNKPYQPADDSINRGQQILNNLRTGLQTITQSNITGVVASQAQALHGAIDMLQNFIDQMKQSQFAVDHNMLVPTATNLQTSQNT